MSCESTSRTSNESSAETYSDAQKSRLEKLPLEIVGKISLDLSPSEMCQLSMSSRSTLEFTPMMESACRTESRGKMRRIFTVLSNEFTTDLQPTQLTIESFIKQMELKNISEKKLACQAQLTALIPLLSSECIQSKKPDQVILLIDFIKTQPRDSVIEFIHRDPNVARMMRMAFVPQAAQKSIDTLLIKNIDRLIAADQMDEVEIFVALIGAHELREPLLGRVVSSFIKRGDLKAVAKFLDRYRFTDESMGEIIKAFIEYQKFGEIDQLQCSPNNRDLLLYDVCLGLMDLKRFAESEELAKKITDTERKKRFDSDAYKEKCQLLLDMSNVDKIFAFARSNPNICDRLLRSAAKGFAYRGQFLQMIGILNGLQVDEKLICSIIETYIEKSKLKEAKLFAEAIKDPIAKNLFLTGISKRLDPTVSS